VGEGGVGWRARFELTGAEPRLTRTERRDKPRVRSSLQRLRCALRQGTRHVGRLDQGERVQHKCAPPDRLLSDDAEVVRSPKSATPFLCSRLPRFSRSHRSLRGARCQVVGPRVSVSLLPNTLSTVESKETGELHPSPHPRQHLGSEFKADDPCGCESGTREQQQMVAEHMLPLVRTSVSHAHCQECMSRPVAVQLPTLPPPLPLPQTSASVQVPVSACVPFRPFSLLRSRLVSDRI
jgi:hypothetical protein